MENVRYGLRQLRRNPGFAAVAIVTLALGIGANTAIFSVVQGVVLAPLPFREPDRLVVVWENNPRFPRVWVSYPNFVDWRHGVRSFERMAAFREEGVDLTGPGAPERVNAKEISTGFFSTLGAKLALGREFSPEEDRRGGAPVVILSGRLWRNRFGGSRGALGKAVTLDGVDYTVAGVAPPGFRLEGDADVYIPLGQGDPLILNDRAAHDGIFAIARLAPGVTVSQGQAEMSTIQNDLDRLYPDANRDLGIYIEPLKRVIVGNVGGTLLLLFGAVGLVLLIACANVANLLLARSAARAREFAVRAALGANRGHLMRQTLTESVVLSLAGAGLGLPMAMWGVRPVLAVVPGILPRSESIGVNAPVLLFTLGVSIAVGILFGLAPALKSWSADPHASLKEGGRGSTRGYHRLQSGLAMAQMALTLVLLVSAGLLFRTIQHLWDVNPGFDTQHLITFKAGVSRSLTKTAASTRIAYRQTIERIRNIPGVVAADYTGAVPLSGQSGTMPFWIGSRKPASLQGAPRVVMFLTGPDYLRTMGIPLLRGRFFTAEDTTKSPCVVAVDSVFVQTYFRDSDPLSQTISAGFSPVGPCRIVGVVGHVRNWGLDDPGAYTRSEAYFPLYQDPDRWVPANYPDASIVVRTRARPGDRYARDQGGGLWRRRRRAGIRCPDDARNCCGVDVGATLSDGAAGGVCVPGAAAGGGGNLRRDFVFGDAEDAGDRRAHGVGGAAGGRFPDGDWAGAADGVGGAGDGGGGGAGSDAGADEFFELAVWSGGGRSGDVRGGVSRIDRRGRFGLLPSGAQGGGSGSDGRPASRVIEYAVCGALDFS